MPALPGRQGGAEKEAGREPVRPPPLFFATQERFAPFWNSRPQPARTVVCSFSRTGGTGTERVAKDRFVEVYSQGVTNVEKIIVDTQTGVNYVLASSALTVGCGMSVLVDADGRPIITPMS